MKHCKHLSLMEKNVGEGVGYLDSMLFECKECGAGLHVYYSAMIGVQGDQKVWQLFDLLGVSLRTPNPYVVHGAEKP